LQSVTGWVGLVTYTPSLTPRAERPRSGADERHGVPIHGGMDGRDVPYRLLGHGAAGLPELLSEG